MEILRLQIENIFALASAEANKAVEDFLNKKNCVSNINYLKISYSVFRDHDFPLLEKIEEYVDRNGILNVTLFVKNNPDSINEFFILNCTVGILDVIKYLIEIYEEHLNKTTGLYNAARKGHIEVVKYLISKGAEINKSYAVSIAAFNGHIDIVKYLVENGADIDNSQVLKSSAYGGHFEIVKYLIENGAKKNFSSLVHAVVTNNFEIVEYLINSGVNIYKPNKKSILHYAKLVNNFELFKYLAMQYNANSIPFPNDIITKLTDDYNKVLCIYGDGSQDNLFNEAIVSKFSVYRKYIF